MSTQGKGTYLINSGWSSGSLVFYEKAYGRTATGDVFTISNSAVKIGGTSQDIDFQWYATGSKSFVLDAGAGTMTLAGIDVSITGDLTIDTEDIALGDNDSLEFGDAADVAITWDTSNLAIIPATDNTGEIQFGNDGTKSMNVRFYGATANYNVLWDMDGGTNGAWLFGANTYGVTVSMYGITTGCGVFWTPSGDSNNGTFIIGASGGSKGVDLYAYGATNGNYLQWDQSADDLLLVGTATQLAVAGTTESTSTTTGSLRTAGGLACVGDFYAGDDIFLTTGAVLNFGAGNVTLTHSTGALACTGALTVSIGTESTSTTTGALIVTGGIGFGGDMYVGDDVFLTSGAILNWDAGDVTLTHSANTLAIAGGNLTVGGTVGITVADQGLTVTCATLNATTGRIAKFDGTVLTPNFGDGYGAIECNLNIGTGAVAGFVAGASSWINLGVNTTTFSAGACLSPLDVGVWGTTGITMTNSKVIMGLKMSCVIDDGANPGELYLFNTNIYSNATTALFDINTIVDFAATASAASSGAYKLPFLKERSTGTTWYMNIYTS